MKFTTLISAVLVFAISAAHAAYEPAVLEFLQAAHVFPPEYRIHVNLINRGTSHEIFLNTKQPNSIASYPQKSRGMIEYTDLPKGEYDAVINDNDSKDGVKSFRLELTRPGAKLYFKGDSLTGEPIHNMQADGYVFHKEFHPPPPPQFYRYQDSEYPCKD